MYELGLAQLPPPERLPEAVERASAGITAAGWQVLGTIESPVRGHAGAIEILLHARRRDPT
jgi:predicted rRNA methylase YqxC with S4 and FtsJ domains